MSVSFTYDELANQLGEVVAATDIDIYGHQVVVYRDHDTLAPFKATVLSEHGSEKGGINNYANPVELARHLVNLEDAAIVQPNLPALHEACMASGIAFPTALLPIVTLIEQERIRPGGPDAPRLRVRKTEASVDGIKTLVVEGEAGLVDGCYVAIEAALREATASL